MSSCPGGFRTAWCHCTMPLRCRIWAGRGKKNSELLKLLVEHEFGAFITADKKMRHEQNWQHYSVPVLSLDVPNLRYDTVKLLVPQVLALLAQPGLASGVHIVQAAS